MKNNKNNKVKANNLNYGTADLNIEIEFGVPRPPSDRGGLGSKLRAAFQAMRSGDSFVLPWTKTSGVVEIYKAAKAVGAKASIRRLPNGTTRVWRV